MNINTEKETKLRVSHFPQVPCKAFHVDVDSIEEAMKIKNILANYDLFQYNNRIKPDYCNVTTIDMWDEDSDGEGNPGWCNWSDEEGYEIDCYELVDGKAVLEECYR